MIDYSIQAAFFKGAEPIRPSFTDFTDFTACFDVMQESLRLTAGAYASLNYCLGEDTSVIIRYGFSGTDGRIIVSVIDEIGRVLTNGFLLRIDRDDQKLRVIPVDQDAEEVVDVALKIIQDYGILITAGIKWGAYLLYEHAEGGLQQYFENAPNQEIH